MSMFLSSSFAKVGAQSRLSQKSVAHRRVHARAEEAKASTPAKAEEEAFVPPTIPKDVPAPYTNGSDSGLQNMARVEEFYVIMWEADKEHIFEVPAGGIAKMRVGKNMMKFARKEQCLCLTTVLRQEFKCSPMFWRVFPNGEVQYLHPADGQYPEKAVAGRSKTNIVNRKIWVDPRESERLGLPAIDIASLKFTDKEAFDL